jgi:alpha-beta hydrolase superfamily lysophospholipase
VIEGLGAPRSHQLAAADGTLLHVSDFVLPAAANRGSVVLMHGLGEHSGRYRHLAQFFNELGYAARCYDHRGHGRSQGARGDVGNGELMLQDAQIVIDDLALHHTRPPYLFGHSMGGLFAARFALARRASLRGLILSSPALAVRLSSIQRAMLKAMFALAPRVGLPNGLQAAFLSHDAAVVAAYKADPLVHGKISARLLRAMLMAIDECHARASSLDLPVLLQVAGDDRLVDASGSRRFGAQLRPNLATLKIYDGFYHEIFNEVNAAEPMADLRAWLAAQEAL